MYYLPLNSNFTYWNKVRRKWINTIRVSEKLTLVLMVSTYSNVKVYILILTYLLTYLLNIDKNIDIVIFRQYRIDIISKSKK